MHKKSASKQVKSQRHVALLRAINVGGKNKLLMADLAKVFVRAGCEGVRTYIASGNVVFDASPKVVSSLATVVAGEIDRRWGLRVPVVLRTADELRRVAMGNPFLRGNEDSLYVMFLADLPDRKKIAGLDPVRSPGDLFEVRGRDIFVRLATGAADTKLTAAYFDAQLGTITTARNWRTVLKLTEMCAEQSGASE